MGDSGSRLRVGGRGDLTPTKQLPNWVLVIMGRWFGGRISNADDFRFARNSMAILKSTIEMAESKSLMAPVLAIDRRVTRGRRAGVEDEDGRV